MKETLSLILVDREPVGGANRQPWQVKALRSRRRKTIVS